MVQRAFSHGFKFPYNVTIDDHSNILIADGYNSRVVKLDWEGNVRGSYTDDDLKQPRGVTWCGGGKFLVCSKDTDIRYILYLKTASRLSSCLVKKKDYAARTLCV